MGGGAWTTQSYTKALNSIGFNATVDSTTGYASAVNLSSNNVGEFYKAHELDKDLDPYMVKVRECRDSDEHPYTIPVILALDVTGSMGSACAAVAAKLDEIMSGLYEKVADVEFMVMGIGDMSYDNAPLQVSQFESDVRILDHLNKIYFERGGGGNGFESYTNAWYFGSRHTDLDCWKRGKKGIIITMGDEPLNPYLPQMAILKNIGDKIENDVDTAVLYDEVIEKYDVYHIAITDRATCYGWYKERIDKSFGKYLDSQHLLKSTSDELPKVISDIVINHENVVTSNTGVTVTDEGIGW